MNKKKSKEISDYLDRRIIICNAVKEPINKDLDCAIKLSVAYEELQQENTNLKQALNEIREYIKSDKATVGYDCYENIKYLRDEYCADNILKIIKKASEEK